MEKIKKIFNINFVFCLIFIVAIAVRVFLLLSEKSFWLDEAALGLNILNRGFKELFRPLDYAQSAPYLFLACTKILTLLFKKSEIVFRFLPFLASVLSLFTFYFLTKSIICNKFAKTLCLLVFGLSFCTLYYTIEFKPYSFDILFSTLVFIIYFKFFDELTIKKELILSAIFAFFPLVSFGSIFPISAVSFLALCKKRFVFPCLMFLNILFQNFFIFQKTKLETGIYNYWQEYFINFNLLKIKLVFFEIVKYFIYPSPLVLPFLILFFLGAYLLYKNNKRVFYPFLLTFISAFCASFLNLYPTFNRNALFLYPVFLIIVFYPLCNIENLKLKIFIGALSLLCAISAVFYPFLKIEIYQREEIKPILQKIEKEKQNGDKIFVMNTSRLQYRFYASKTDNDVRICNLYEDNFKTLENFCKNSCWVIYATEADGGKNFESLKNYVKRRGGKNTLSLKGAYLFELP